MKAELQNVLVSELAARKFTYTRSDGSQWTLTLKDVVDRMPDLEMAYNPNDCVELRWGAPDRSDEASTCKRHAPAAQRAKMTKYRAWFRERHWPRTLSRCRHKRGHMRDDTQHGSRRSGGYRVVVAGWVVAAAGLAMLAVAPLLAQDDQLAPRSTPWSPPIPNALAGHDGNALRWRDGTVMPVSDGAESKTFPELLRHASIIDQFRIPYPRGPLEKPPAVDADPGRFRNAAFLQQDVRRLPKGRGDAASCLACLGFPRLGANQSASRQ